MTRTGSIRFRVLLVGAARRTDDFSSARRSTVCVCDALSFFDVGSVPSDFIYAAGVTPATLSGSALNPYDTAPISAPSAS